MNSFRIVGGNALTGTIEASGNKNAVLPMIAAALLTDEPVILDHVPDIGDVQTMLTLAHALGATVDWDRQQGVLTLHAAQLLDAELPRNLCREIRAGILFAAPLLHRSGCATMFPPGGDVIGRRRLDVHFGGLRRMGAQIDTDDRFVFRTHGRLEGADLFLPEASVTGTAQLLLAAVLAEGTTTIRNAACEPHIGDLARLLTGMGARIEGTDSNTLTVHGVSRLQGVRHRVVSDHTEVGSLLALGAATGGGVTVTGVDPSHYPKVKQVFARFGVDLECGADTVSIAPGQQRCVQPDLDGGIPVIDDGPWPHFPSDLMSVMIVLATQATGTVLFFEKMYESRMYFVDRLVAMGANAVICDPHRAVICGPSRLHGITLSSPDIRAGMALVAAALCAPGESIIRNVHLIDRGYESIETKLSALGAAIERVTES